MSNKQIIEMLLKTSGMELRNYELNRDGDGRSYEGEGYRNDKCEVQFASDSFEGAICEIMEQIYDTENLVFESLS